MTDTDTLRAVTDAAAAVFSSPPRRAAASAYLQQRGIDAAALPYEWLIGYAPPGWTRLVDTLAQNFHDQALLDAGVVRTSSRGSLIDTFRDRMIFGIHDRQGAIVGFIGRDLSGAPGAPKYLNTQRNELFDKSTLLFGLWEGTQNPDRSQPVLVEGPLDALAIAARGHHDAIMPIAPCGTAFTANQAGQIADIASQHDTGAVVAMDADTAGRVAAVNAGEQLRAVGVHDVRIATLPHGTDPAEYLTNPKNGLDAFHADHAQPLITVQAQNAIAAQGDRMQWVEGRLAAARTIAGNLASYPAAVTARQIGWLANALHLDASTLTFEFAKAYRTAEPKQINRGASATPSNAMSI